MQVVQCILMSDKTKLLAWLDIPIGKPLRVGNLVTLKDSDDPKRKWRIDHLGAVLEKSDLKRSSTWFRNDVVREGKSFRQAR